MNIGIFGEFKVEVYRGDKVIKELPWQKNIVTDAWLNDFFDNNLSDRGMMVGTGNSTPSVGDVSLDNAIGYTGSKEFVESVNDPVLRKYHRINKYIFTEGTVTGTLAELGITSETDISFTPSATQYMSTRALFKDEFGSPTTLSITNDDRLEVTYKYGWSLERDADGVPKEYSGSIILDGVTHNYTAITYGDIFSALRTTPTSCKFYEDGVLQTTDYNDNRFNVTYTSVDSTVVIATEGPKYLDLDITIPPEEGNFTNGIDLIELWKNTSSALSYYFSFNPPIIKNDTQEINLKFRVSMDRKI